jgi:hypothetical protein
MYSRGHYGAYLGGEGFTSKSCHSFTVKYGTILVGYSVV